MPDRIASDHPSVDTYRVTVARHGGRRRRLELPADVLPVDEPVRVLVDGDTRHGIARASPTADTATLSGVYATPDQARDPGGATDYLERWLREHDVSPGASVLVDVVEPDVAYGLRLPGERTVYETVAPPASSLQDIARQVDDGE